MDSPIAPPRPRVWPLVLLAALAVRARGGERIDGVPELGPHYRVVTIEKSVHPQNLLVAYTRLDAQCRVVPDPKNPGAPTFAFYWLMGGTRYKRVNSLILRGIRRRLELLEANPPSADGSFSVRLNVLAEFAHDLGPAPTVRIRPEKIAGGCRTASLITLGPSDGRAQLRLDTIHSEAAITGPISARIRSITLKGTDPKSGKPVARVYTAK